MPESRRRACVVIPLFAVRSDQGWGAGEIPDIARFARWARAAGFQMVQLLPTHEVTGGETSPYAAASAFALDPVYLSLDACEDFAAIGGRAALAAADRAAIDELAAAKVVSWRRLRALKIRHARRAFAHFSRHEWGREGSGDSSRARAFARFRQEGSAWLDDHALFAVLHDRYHKAWLNWPRGVRDRVPAALEAARARDARSILFKEWLQWQLDQQWHGARADAHALGVELMGDLPFVVAGDSADVWSRRENFRIDLRAGTPPDAFSPTGQDWGLPVYDWDAIAESDFAWMRARAARSAELYASYRVDHVIGLYRTYYRAADGSREGFSPPGEADQIRLGETLFRLFAASCEIVAEDLGMVPEFLRPSLTRLGIPGYRVFRWEKDDVRKDGETVVVFRDPAAWPELSVATSGTHDIETNAEWYDELPDGDRRGLLQLPGLADLVGHPKFDDRVRDALLRAVYAAPSRLVAVPIQDALGTRERINVPGTVNDDNWTYRMPMDVAALLADRATTARLARLSAETGRA